MLERERAADAEWRAAVAAGAAGAKRASYEARWGIICARPGGPIQISDVPWILLPAAAASEPPAPGALPFDPGELRRVVLYGTSSPEERRKRLRAEIVRWHPDKWEARWGRALAPGQRQRVLEGVKEVAQALNALHAEVQAEVAAAAVPGPVAGPPPP